MPVLISPAALLRARAFLPNMKEENEKLEAKLQSGVPREQLDIENVDDSEPHLEMVFLNARTTFIWV